MGIYLATTMYDSDAGAFYNEVGLPGDEDLGDDVVTGGAVGAAKVVVGDQTAIVDLTNSTGVTPDNTIGDLTAVVAAAGEATAADLTTTQAALADVKDSLADLAGKVNEIIAVLESSGLTTVTP